MAYVIPAVTTSSPRQALDAPTAGGILALMLGSQRGHGTLTDEAAARSQLAKEIYDSRRSRDQEFPEGLFADPAWDILLILYWAELIQQRLSVRSVCVAAAVPPTTALRWVERLVELELLQRGKHPTDGRVTSLELTKSAKETLDRHFDLALAARSTLAVR